jgi:hypothetical protein
MGPSNLFPTVYGKGGKVNVNDAICPPAAASGDKGNTAGAMGFHLQLMRNMNDVSMR